MSTNLPDGSARWVFSNPFWEYGHRDFVALTDALANGVKLYPGVLLYGDEVGECIYTGHYTDGRITARQVETNVDMYLHAEDLALVLQSVDSSING